MFTSARNFCFFLNNRIWSNPSRKGKFSAVNSLFKYLKSRADVDHVSIICYETSSWDFITFAPTIAEDWSGCLQALLKWLIFDFFFTNRSSNAASCKNSLSQKVDEEYCLTISTKKIIFSAEEISTPFLMYTFCGQPIIWTVIWSHAKTIIFTFYQLWQRTTKVLWILLKQLRTVHVLSQRNHLRNLEQNIINPLSSMINVLKVLALSLFLHLSPNHKYLFLSIWSSSPKRTSSIFSAIFALQGS